MAFILQTSSEPGRIFWLIFPFFFVGLWLVVTLFLSRATGWSKLADYYRCEQPFFGELIRMQSASFGVFSSYNNCVNFGVSPEGLYMVPIWLVRPFHPPLLIRWNEISAEPYKMLSLFDTVRMRFDRVPHLSLSIRQSLFDRLVALSGGRLQPASKKMSVS